METDSGKGEQELTPTIPKECEESGTLEPIAFTPEKCEATSKQKAIPVDRKDSGMPKSITTDSQVYEEPIAQEVFPSTSEKSEESGIQEQTVSIPKVCEEPRTQEPIPSYSKEYEEHRIQDTVPSNTKACDGFGIQEPTASVSLECDGSEMKESDNRNSKERESPSMKCKEPGMQESANHNSKECETPGIQEYNSNSSDCERLKTQGVGVSSLSRDSEGCQELDKQSHVSKTSRNQHGKLSFMKPCMAAAYRFLTDITLEPMLFVKNLSQSSIGPVVDNFKLYKFCVQDLNYTEDECSSLNSDNSSTIRVESQHLVNHFEVYEQIMMSIVPLIIVLFVGSWSDKHGRKNLLISTLVGYSLYALIFLLDAVFETWPVELLLLADFLQGAGGGDILFYLAVYSFFADRTTPEDRFYRMAIMSAIWYVGNPVGSLVGNAVFGCGGHILSFGVSSALFLGCLLYVLIFIKDYKINKVDGDERDSSRESRWRSVVDLDNVKATLKYGITGKPGKGLTIMYCLISAMFLQMGCEVKNGYLWSQQVFKWSIEQYNYWSATEAFYHQIMNFLMTLVLSAIGLHDCITGATLTFFEAIGNCWRGFATKADQWWFNYGASAVNIAPDLIYVSIRSILSKVSGEDSGKAYSLLAVLQIAWVLVEKIMFIEIYDATLEVYPSAQSFVQVGFGIIVMCLFLSVWYYLTRYRKGRAKDTEKCSRIEVLEEDHKTVGEINEALDLHDE